MISRANTLILILACLVPIQSHAVTLDAQFEIHLDGLRRPTNGWSLWHLHEARRLQTSVTEGHSRLGRVIAPMANTRRRLPDLLRGELISHLASSHDLSVGIQAGYPTTTQFLGPLRGPGTDKKKAWTTDNTKHPGIFGPTQWRNIASDRLHSSLRNGDLLNCPGDCHGVLELWMNTSQKQATIFILSSNGPISAWLDNEKILQWDGERSLRPWQHAIPLTLNKGHHRLSVHFGHRENTPQTSVRVIDTRDGTLKRSHFIALPNNPSLAGFTAEPNKTAKPEATYSKLPGLSERLSLHFATDKEDMQRTASNLAHKLKSNPGDPKLWALLARTHTDNSNLERQSWEKVATLSGRSDSEALARLYTMAREHKRSESALTYCRELQETDSGHPVAVECDVHIITQALGKGAGLERLNRAGKAAAGVARLELLRHELLAQNQQDLRAAHIAKRIAPILSHHVGLIRRAARLYSQAGLRDTILKTVEAALKWRPFSATLHTTQGELLAGQARDSAKGRADLDLSKAIGTLDSAIDMQPSAPSLFEARGRLHLEQGSRALGLDDLDRSLSMRPQNLELTSWRRTLSERRTLADEHSVKVSTLRQSAKALAPAPEGATVLLDKRVTRYHVNALTTRWRQRVIRIDGNAAARQFTSIRLPYTPRVDRLQVLEAEILRPDGTKARPQRISDERPSGKQNGIYTLTAFKVIHLPKIQPGDLVHVQTRQVDIGARNLFGPHFGSFLPAQDRWPINRNQIIIEAPKDRPLKTHQQGAGIWTKRTEELPGTPAYTRHVWEGTLVPALRYEPRMPGYSEVGAFVSISSFRSWAQLVDWYRDFIKDQLNLTTDLERTAQNLIKGKSTLKERVSAIHQWVVKNTRYVGIEFGIHGFKPYSLREIVQRGYGDCKDKAILFIAMLAAVDISSEFVLIRTRDRGLIPENTPSLWVFNHAIAYVPGLDTYVDATSELAALGEVPALDQGGSLIRFPVTSQTRASSFLGTLPFTPSDQNLYLSSASITITQDGAARALFDESVAGTQAASMRSLFENQAQQEKRLGELLASHYPGASLNAFTVTGLAPDSSAVNLQLKAQIPGFARMDGTQLSIPVHANPDGILQEHGPVGVRKHPLQLPHLRTERTMTSLNLPKNFTLLEAPPAVLITNEFGDYQFKVSLKDKEGLIHIQETLRFKTATIKPSEYNDFQRFLQAVVQHRRTRLIATTRKSSNRR